MRPWLRRTFTGIAVLAGLAAAGAAGIWIASESALNRRYPTSAATVAIPADAASVAEGRRLATVYGCMDGCHGKDGRGTLFFDEPLIARLVAPNLTVAVRQYSDAALIHLIRQGVRPDGRSVFVMPSESFVHLTDADVARIVAFLRTLPEREGPRSQLSLGPIGRLGVATGKFRTAAELIRETAHAPPARDALGERGRYLASSICSECHGADLGGHETPDFVAPALAVVSAYSPEEFRRLMRSGEPIGGRTLGLMRVRARQGLSRLTDEEIDALYEYLRSLGSP